MKRVNGSPLTFTLEELQEADENSGGYCIACGSYHSGIEPDARSYRCEDCEEHAVYGAMEIILLGHVK